MILKRKSSDAFFVLLSTHLPLLILFSCQIAAIHVLSNEYLAPNLLVALVFHHHLHHNKIGNIFVFFLSIIYDVTSDNILGSSAFIFALAKFIYAGFYDKFFPKTVYSFMYSPPFQFLIFLNIFNLLIALVNGELDRVIYHITTHIDWLLILEYVANIISGFLGYLFIVKISKIISNYVK